jgi:nitroimidazol reductase NimA-like FMN-containing flavoprotein (pyridoxamine 5'-phosphate oxidase superfamily)
MKPELKSQILNILKDHRLLTLATIRPDGWPQATTVGYGSVGMTLYFLCGADSQKARNIAACNKVSLAIDHDTDEMMELQGLSMAAIAEPVTDPAKTAEIFGLLMAKYPKYKDLPMPDPATVRYFRLVPKVISVLDYSKGFGHTELVEVTAEDLTAA